MKMKITIEGESKEISAFILEIQKRHETDYEIVDFVIEIQNLYKIDCETAKEVANELYKLQQRSMESMERYNKAIDDRAKAIYNAVGLFDELPKNNK